MTTKEFKDKYFAKKAVIHCPTTEVTATFHKLLNEILEKAIYALNRHIPENWTLYQERTCYRPSSNNGEFCHIEWYQERDHMIYHAADFLNDWHLRDVENDTNIGFKKGDLVSTIKEDRWKLILVTNGSKEHFPGVVIKAEHYDETIRTGYYATGWRTEDFELANVELIPKLKSQ